MDVRRKMIRFVVRKNSVLGIICIAKIGLFDDNLSVIQHPATRNEQALVTVNLNKKN